LLIRCTADKLEQFNNADQMPIDLFEIPQEFVPNAMIDSIGAMTTGVLHHLILPKPKFHEAHSTYLSRVARERDQLIRQYKASQLLTESQRDAVYAICKKEHGNCPFILYGPPGTGKTFTIAETVQCLLRMNPNNRILICTPSNRAADRVAEKLMEYFESEDSAVTEGNVLRLYSTGTDYYFREKRFDNITKR
jgi:chromosomal replication initiation ATPase DnaA